MKSKIKNFLINQYNFIKGNTLPDIKKIKFGLKKKSIKINKKILIATSSGGLKPQVVFESMLALSLDNSGVEIEFLLCDHTLPACIMNTCFNSEAEKIVTSKKNLSCVTCFETTYNLLTGAGFKVNKFSDYIEKQNIKKINDLNFDNLSLQQLRDFNQEDIKLGEHAYSGTLRYFAKTKIDDEPYGKKLLCEYLKSSLITKEVVENLFKKNFFDRVILNHGIYVPQGTIVDVAKKNKIQISTWCPGYRKNSFCITNGDTYHRALIYESNSNWENVKLTPEINNLITTYLESRQTGTNDWIHFYKDKPNFNVDDYFDQINIDKKKPIIGMATSVLWDAQIDFPSNFYSDPLEWVFDTIDFFVKNKNLQLIIRISPAEVNIDKPARQKVFDEIKKRYSEIPSNIYIIKPEDPISSYAVLEKCEHIIIYGSRIGIELAAKGKKIIVCGEGFIRNKEIALDVQSREEYIKILSEISNNSLPFREVDIERAKKYAYHFFFRRMFEFKVIKERKGKWPNFTYSNDISDLISEKKDPSLELTVNSIINDKDFILEKYR